MPILDGNDPKVKEFPISFKFEKDQISLLCKGETVGSMDNKELEILVGVLAHQLLNRSDTDMIVFNGKTPLVLMRGKE